MIILSTHRITASQLVNLLQILGALVADYVANPDQPMSPELLPLVKSPIQWKELPSLRESISVATKGGDKVSSLYSLGTELKEAFPQFHQNPDYTSTELQMLKAIRAYLMTDSEPALNYIVRNASAFKDPTLADAFVPDAPKINNKPLKDLVKSLVGRDGVHLAPPEIEMLEQTNPKKLEQYKLLRKQHNADFKIVLMNYVRATKKPLADYKQVYNYALSQGFDHSLVPGFTGKIDDQGRWYTQDDKLLNGAPNLMTYSHIIMNDGKDPDQQWVLKAVKPDGSFSYGYTMEFQRNQSKAKYVKVRDLIKKIPAIRKRWLEDVKNFDITSKDSVAAVVLEILYSFAARVGSQPGRGVSTLLINQIKPTAQGLNLAYLGKDSIPTKHVLKNEDPIHAKIIDAITQMTEGRGKKEPIFCYQVGDKWKKCGPSSVNEAFRTFGAPAELSVHKLRTTRGSNLFAELMAADATKRPPKDEKEALLRYKRMTEEVGKLLNHKRGVGGSNEKVTGTTAATSYIDGDLQVLLFTRWGFRLPKNLEKLVRSEND